MPADLLDAYTARLLAIDPLLRLDPEPPAGEELVAGGTCGWAGVVDLDPSHPAASWSRLRTYALAPRWAGDPAELDELVARWLEWMRAAGSEAAGPDSQTAISWPSRDVDAARVFYAHGLMPSTTIAVRTHAPPGTLPAGTLPGGPLPAGTLPAGVGIRPAGVADAAAVVSLGAEELHYESGLSPLGERPGHADLRRQEMATRLDRPEPWAWLAERAGEPVGVLVAERPEDATRMGTMTSRRPAAYVSLLSVTAAERGGGIGSALAAVARRTFEDAGIAASLLHYGSFNPLSGPFWCRHGYRPLWTIWATQPASAQR